MEIIFVLVRPAVPQNVGAAARALKTMGFDQLRLVDSSVPQQLVHQKKEARILAHGAGDLLDRVTVHADLPAALADVDFVVGTSAKQRHDKRYNVPAAELAGLLAAKGTTVQRAAIVFGCEESGLSNAELAHCHMLTSVPLATTYPSLNLAQAVMLYAYELTALAGATAQSAAGSSEWLALRGRLITLLARLEVPAEGVLASWVGERSALLTAEDVGFLHMLCRHLEERLPPAGHR